MNFRQFSHIAAAFAMILFCNRTGRAQVVLYDNMTVAAEQIRSIPGPRFTDNRDNIAQPFITAASNNVSLVSLSLQRVGRPKGNVSVEIWSDNGDGTPDIQVGTVGTFDVAAISASAPAVVTMDGLVTGLTPDSSYLVVLDISQATIPNGDNSFRWGVLGLISDEQSEGTNGANRLVGTVNGGPWRPMTDNDVLGCHPVLKACPNYLRMTVNSASLLGDYDGSGQLDAADIDMLSASLRNAPFERSFDLNNDGTITQTDREAWIHELSNTYFGDANLDGEFNSSDLTEVFKAGEYEDNITLNSTWSEGDWNGDGDFNSGDLVVAFKDGGYEFGPKVVANAVPEPSGAILLAIGVMGLCRFRSSRSPTTDTHASCEAILSRKTVRVR